MRRTIVVPGGARPDPPSRSDQPLSIF